MNDVVQVPLGATPAGPLAHLPRALRRPIPTGAKVFLILVASLLPLALIAMIVTLQNLRQADAEAQARLHRALEESSGALTNVLASQIGELRSGVAALEANRNDAPACTRLAGTFAAYAESGTRFAINDPSGKILCGQRISAAGVTVLRPGEVEARLTDSGLAVRISGQAGLSATAYYPAAALADVARPNGFVPEYGTALQTGDGKSLELKHLGGGALARKETTKTDLDIDGLSLQMSMPGAPITGPLLFTTLLLVLMWIAAAAIGWFVVDRLMIRPLRRLRRAVRAYQPGEVLDLKAVGDLPAAEIQELGETFRDLTSTVQAHEADLAEGLNRQTRLTREVHHRVKNNLQVIASLINFHARGAKSVEATDAYASIQRRVDALAVVHRHHYAELEETRGLELRSVIGELSSNIRATAPDRSSIGITLELEPFLVTQDTAVAVSFLLTEIIELAMSCAPRTQVRISFKGLPDDENRAMLRVTSPALIETPELTALLENRYGRVMTGLARQLRTQLHHDPLSGAYEASIAVTGKP